MRSALRLLFAFLFLSSSIVLAAEIRFENHRIVASGLTPNAPVVLFGVTLEGLGYEVQAERFATLTTGDLLGTATYSTGREIPARSFWVAVDLISGRYVSGGPPGTPATIAVLDPSEVTGAGRLVRRAVFSEILVARPGLGAWTLTAGDGGASDDDQRFDGRITTSIGRMRPVGGGVPPPSQFAPNDVIVAIDPWELRVSILQLGN